MGASIAAVSVPVAVAGARAIRVAAAIGMAAAVCVVMAAVAIGSVGVVAANPTARATAVAVPAAAADTRCCALLAGQAVPPGRAATPAASRVATTATGHASGGLSAAAAGRPWCRSSDGSICGAGCSSALCRSRQAAGIDRHGSHTIS